MRRMRGPSVLQGKVSGVFQRVRDGCGILGFASQMRHILIPVLRAFEYEILDPAFALYWYISSLDGTVFTLVSDRSE
jgi:hypothetical protein